MTPYTLASINEDTNQFFTNLWPTNDPYYFFFAWLGALGVRYNELRNCINWGYWPHEKIVIPLSKGQDFRILLYSDWDTELIKETFEANSYFTYVNKTTANLVMKRHFPHWATLDSGKFLGTYLFRHRYIKNLAASGQTPAQIAATIGESNINNVNGYINSVIMY